MHPGTEHVLSPFEKTLIAQGAKYMTLTGDLRAQAPSKAFHEYYSALPDRLQDRVTSLKITPNAMPYMGDTVANTVSQGLSASSVSRTASIDAAPSPNFDSRNPTYETPTSIHNKEVVIIDLCDDTSDQETDDTIPAVMRSLGALVESKAIPEEMAAIEKVEGRDESELSCEGTPRQQILPAHVNCTLPTPVSLKREADFIEMATPQQVHSSNRSGAPSAALPLNLASQIDQWYDQNNGRVPPFATNYQRQLSLYKTISGAEAHYWHRSGVSLEIVWYDLPAHLYPPTNKISGYLRLKVASGTMIEPFFIYYDGSGRVPWFKGTGSKFKAWLGLDGPCKDGFEFDASVIKVSEEQNTGFESNVENLQNTTRTAGSLLTNTKSKKATNFQSTLSRRATRPPERYGDLVSWASVKRKKVETYPDDDEFNDDFQSVMPSTTRVAQRHLNQEKSTQPIKKPRGRPRKVIVSSVMSTTPEPPTGRNLSPRSSNAKGPDAGGRATATNNPLITTDRFMSAKPTGGFNLSALDVHIVDNTVVLFYKDSSSSVSSPPSRIRMINSCDTVSKLFAQGTAGSVFGDSITVGETRVLSLKVNNTAYNIPIVQDDEEDFEAFVSALRHATCWRKDSAGRYEGSCTVEVRGLM